MTVAKLTRTPTCHPLRPHYARNLCEQCYNMSWRIRHGLKVRGPHDRGDRTVTLQLPTHPEPHACGKCKRADGLYWQRPEVCCRYCGWALLVEPPGGFTDRDLLVVPRRNMVAV